MTPYYDKGDARIYLGDSLELLDALRPELAGQVDAVVMDPPYASGARTEAGKRASGAMLADGSPWEHKPIFGDEMTTGGFVWLMRQAAVLARPLAKPGASMLSFIDWRQWGNLLGAVECAGWRVNQMIVWDKLYAAMGNGYRNRHELILHASIGTPTVVRKDGANVIEAAEEGLEDVLKLARVRNTVHPSMKPIALMERLVRVVCPPGGLVLDPFMGSGSTLLAARNLGCRAVGFEVVEEYAEAAAKRLDGMVPTNVVGTSEWQGGLL